MARWTLPPALTVAQRNRSTRIKPGVRSSIKIREILSTKGLVMGDHEPPPRCLSTIKRPSRYGCIAHLLGHVQPCPRCPGRPDGAAPLHGAPCPDALAVHAISALASFCPPSGRSPLRFMLAVKALATACPSSGRSYLRFMLAMKSLATFCPSSSHALRRLAHLGPAPPRSSWPPQPSRRFCAPSLISSALRRLAHLGPAPPRSSWPPRSSRRSCVSSLMSPILRLLAHLGPAFTPR